MPTRISVHKTDETHVLVKREDLDLMGHVLATFALVTDGHWQRMGEGDPYPDDSQIKVQPA